MRNRAVVAVAVLALLVVIGFLVYEGQGQPPRPVMPVGQADVAVPGSPAGPAMDEAGTASQPLVVPDVDLRLPSEPGEAPQ